MTAINVLTPGFTSSNGSAFLFPLVVHRRALKDSSLDVRIVNRTTPGITECDLLVIDSKEFRNEWTDQTSRTLDLIASYRQAGTRIAWFDTTDGTGTLQAPVFTHVDAYFKSQLLADRSRYTETIYGGRVHSEYYNKSAGVTDDETAINEPVTPDDTAKLGISWNSGLADYSTYGPMSIGLYRYTRLKQLLRYPTPAKNPDSDRPNNLSARFGATYSRATVRYQREKIQEILSARLNTRKLKRRGYMKELNESKVVLSPFGWGEITLKDFEVFLTGGMLLKPSMNHMETWPNFYENDTTYLSHDWDLTNLEERIQWAIDNGPQRNEIAVEGQRRYAEHTSGPNAAELFTTHLNSLVNTVVDPTEINPAGDNTL